MYFNLTYNIGVFLTNLCHILCCKKKDKRYYDTNNRKIIPINHGLKEIVCEHPYLRYRIYGDEYV